MTPTLRPIVARINGLTNEIKKIKANTKLHHSQKQYTLMLLKSEARHTMLAYAFIRRVPYSIVESSCNEKPNTHLLARTITSFGVGRKIGVKRPVYWRKDWEQYKDDLDKELNEWLNQLPEQSFVQSIVSGVKNLVGVS